MLVRSVILIGLCLIGLCLAAACTASDSPAVLDYEVINTYPHRDSAFTQGLTFNQGSLWEGTGQYGHSSVAKIRLKDGVVLASQHLPARYFGEGITLFKGRLLQLTWKAQTLFVYDAATLEKLSTLPYSGEGWGITHNGEQLIVSDGSATLRFHTAQDFSLQRSVDVKHNGIPVNNLNELEWVDGLVLANIWQSDWIVAIDPSSGAVIATLDLSALTKEQGQHADVLNGIAWRDDTQTLLVTGKYWPTLYEIRVPGLPKLQ